MNYQNFYSNNVNVCSEILLKNANKRSIMLLQQRTRNDETLIDTGAKLMEKCKTEKQNAEHIDYCVEMTNEEYRERLRIEFENIHENYKLKWFYRFVMEKLYG